MHSDIFHEGNLKATCPITVFLMTAYPHIRNYIVLYHDNAKEKRVIILYKAETPSTRK